MIILLNNQDEHKCYNNCEENLENYHVLKTTRAVFFALPIYTLTTSKLSLYIISPL
jgi:hypothetical protein